MGRDPHLPRGAALAGASPVSTLTSDFRPPAREEVSVCCWARPGSRKLNSSSPPFQLSLVLVSMLAPKVVHAFHLPVSLLLLKCVPGHVATVRVSFTCQLDWPWGPRRLAGCGGCLRGFCGQSKSGPPRGVCVGWGVIQSHDPRMAQKVEEEQTLSANPMSTCSCPGTSGTLSLWALVL